VWRLAASAIGASVWRNQTANGGGAFQHLRLPCHGKVYPAGLPEPIAELFRKSVFGEVALLLAIAEHKVPLVGGQADSQCDVWALLKTASDAISLSVEAKANEPFGEGNKSLEDWLVAGESERSRRNRQERWEHINENLPPVGHDTYKKVPYQLLHRCAAAVIEARRFRVPNAALVVQSFNAPDESFEAFSRLCQAVSVNAVRGHMQVVTAGEIRLGVGWADCPFATDAEVAAVV
jgi:hypothetical protein